MTDRTVLIRVAYEPSVGEAIPDGHVDTWCDRVAIEASNGVGVYRKVSTVNVIQELRARFLEGKLGYEARLAVRVGSVDHLVTNYGGFEGLAMDPQRCGYVGEDHAGRSSRSAGCSRHEGDMMDGTIYVIAAVLACIWVATTLNKYK